MANLSSFGSFFRSRGDGSLQAPTEEAAAQVQAVSSPAPAPQLPDQATISKRRAQAAAAQLFGTFGKITSVFMRAKNRKPMLVSELECLVMPAVLTRQCLVAEVYNEKAGITVPVCAVLWATVSETVDQRLTANAGKTIHLSADEWRSGSIPWLIDSAGDPRTVARLLKTVAAGQFAASGIKVVTQGADGKAVVSILYKAAPAAGAARPN